MTNILQVINLEKEFKVNLKRNKVLKWVNLSIEKWQIYGFLWPNWAGKTTTLKCILGFLKPTIWEVKIFDKIVGSDNSMFNKIWYTPESAYYYDHLTWLEFIIFMWQLHGLSKTDCIKIGEDLLDKVWLLFAKDKFVKTYSKWMKQRLGLAASLINDPEIIFWDEPMSWLDPLGRALVKQFMKTLKEKWKTIFFNTHILWDVEEVADKFGIIYNWKIVCEDYVKNLEIPLEDLFIQEIQKYSDMKSIR